MTNNKDIKEEEDKEQKDISKEDYPNSVYNSFESDFREKNSPRSPSSRREKIRKKIEYTYEDDSEDNYKEDLVYNFISKRSAHSNDESEIGEVLA